MLTLDQAIKTAIEFENKVCRTYEEAERRAEDPVGRKVFHVLAEEEKGHVAYLECRLAEWKKNGRVMAEQLKTAIPDQAKIREGAKQLAKQMRPKEDHSSELQLLQRALGAEQEVSAFYRRMVSELSDEGQRLFERFVEIEEGHLAVVQAEIDAVSGLGFWFDVQEFQLEAL